MKKFIYLKIIILAIGVIMVIYNVNSQEVFDESYSEPALTWEIIPIFFVFSMIGTLFVIYLQKLNSRNKLKWTKPSWDLNPFDFSNPIEFFQFSGVFFVIVGFFDVFAQYIKFTQSNIEAFGGILSGVGILTAVKLIEFFYRDKFK